MHEFEEELTKFKQRNKRKAFLQEKKQKYKLDSISYLYYKYSRKNNKRDK